MAKPIIAIVGRPNVGKSTLFNKLTGKRLAIVEDTPGVTRDRLYCECEWLNHTVMLVDTGGIEPKTDDGILSKMRVQANIAIESADVIILVTDLNSGVTANDADIASMLLKSGKPVVLCVNKCDRIGAPPAEFYEFYNLGLGDPFPVSSVHGNGTGDLLDECFKHIDFDKEDEDDDDKIKVAIIGKPNVGKSSLVNKISGEERVIVADMAGTTRDATEGFTEQDSKVAGYAHEQGKACVIAINKWDAIEKETNTMNEFTKKLQTDFSFMSYAPFVFISAKTGQRLNKLFELIVSTYEQNCRRISTGMLNDMLAYATAKVQPPSDKGKRLKIYYMTQASTNPPTFVTFCNRADLFHFSYRRYLENQIRETFSLTGTPIKMVVRERGNDKG